LVRLYSGASTRMSVGRFLQQAAAGNSGGTGDDDFANVVLLLDGDGTSGDNNNTFTDSSTNGYTITESGSVVQGSFSPYGDNWSVDLTEGSSATASYLTTSALSTIAASSGDFTIEFWLMPTSESTSYSGTSLATIMDADISSGGSSNAWWAIHQSNDDLIFAHNNANRLTASNVFNNKANQWNHCVLSRSGTTLKWFVNGSESASTTYSAQIDGGRAIDIGKQGTTRWNKCHISNIRIVNGTALYTSSYTVPTSPLTDVSGTVLLCCKSNRFTDESSQNETVTPTGTVKVTPFSPFKNDDARDITTDGGSAYWNGSSYLNTASGATALGTGNLTVEFWINTTDTSFNIMNPDSSTGNGFWGLMVQSGDLRWNNQYSLTNLWVVDGAPIIDGAWHHVAIIKNSNVFKVFYDGVSQNLQSGSFTDSWNYPYSDGLRIGSGNLATFTGYLSDIRLLAGTALYSSDFTPPTAPLTAVTNTKLLMNFQDAGIYDLSGINNLDTVGNAQIDTAVKKYGTGSLEFDGSGDYLKILQNDDLELGSGDYTIECWVNISAAASVGGIFSKGLPSTLNTSTWSLEFNTTNNYVSWYVQAASTTYIITGSQNIKTSNWIHIAVTRSGNDTKLFVNGVQDGSTYTGGYTIATGGDLYLGTGFYAPTTRTITGFIDDLRITKGIARYTSSFTPPDAALPKF
jgi:hypothetical protein